jgi:asparagine synthase (glutamine-hydrolysing)
MKMSGMREKAILRGAVRDLLPRRIVARRKQPFMTPVRPWFFSSRAPAFVQDCLSARAVTDAGLFAPGAVARLRDALDRSVPGSLEGIRLELVTMLVLGTQLLHQQFVGTGVARS